MSTTGRKDDAGAPGDPGRWKNGFNLDCGLPSPLLLEQRSRGPWSIVTNHRASKNRHYIVRTAGLTNFNFLDDDARENFNLPVAWIGADKALAEMLIERFNAYEMAKEFPPRG